jgi:uncharacterized protein DUF4956
MKNAFASLLRHGPAAGPARTLGAPTVWRLIGCYLVAAVLVAAINSIAPLAGTSRGRVWSMWAEGLVFGVPSGGHVVPVWLDALLAMAGAFVMTVPIVIVYVRTRTHAAFDDSLANTVLVLPSIVTAILIIVQNSLALAFSLAGIVAAVRFRINLKESRDALYIFAAVAIGFAAGVYALDVALMASLVFVLLEVLTWRTDLGSEPVGNAGDGRKRAGKARRDPAPEPVAEPALRDATIRVQVTDVEEGRQVVESLLDDLTKSWHRSRITGGGGPVVVLEYEVRLRRRHPAEEVRDRLHEDGEPFVVAVDLSPLDRPVPRNATTAD